MILNIYKPKNWTSFDVVAKTRGIIREFESKKVKVGHAGTLDPLATGVLIVLTHNDTKKQSEFMKMAKEYKAKIALGAYSDTYDLEGKLHFSDLEFNLPQLETRIHQILPDFIGEIEQTVPFYSAVKVGGKALYKKARSGEILENELPVKRINIYSIEILNFEYEQFSQFNVKLPVLTCKINCSSGTYIRSIANDLGVALGTKAVLTDLERTKVGEFSINNAININDLKTKISELHAQQLPSQFEKSR